MENEENREKKSYQPGDLILNRYMPDATEEEREAARENLRVFAVVVVDIAKRLAKEESECAKETPDNYP